ncbi:MAG: hypothetical protein ACLURX_05235 [Clostridia bacterium]|jgi:hypothetical protein
MKKMIITIIILAIIFIGMVINRQIEQANEIKIEEIQLVENYMEKIYGWSEITNQALPEFDNLNEANTKWLWGIVRKNIEEEEITYETINEKVKELYGEELNIKYPKEGMEFIKYNEETNDYIPSEIELDANDDRFYINKITKIKNGYTAEIVEYLVDYTDFDNNNIYLKNLNGEIVEKLTGEETKQEVTQKVKEKIDKFTKKKATLKKLNDEKVVIQKVEKEN